MNINIRKRTTRKYKKIIRLPLDISVVAICVPLIVTLHIAYKPFDIWKKNTNRICVLKN